MTQFEKYDIAIKSLGCVNYLLLGIPSNSVEFYNKFKPVAKTNFDVENEYITDAAQYPFTFQQLVDQVTLVQSEYDAKQYQRDRTLAYPSLQKQLDMQYWDSVNGTTIWQDTINAVKQQYPKATQ
jgi:hypothetical protein